MSQGQTMTLSPSEISKVPEVKKAPETESQPENVVIMILPTTETSLPTDQNEEKNQSQNAPQDSEKISVEATDLEQGEISNASTNNSDKTLEVSFIQRDKFVMKVLAILMVQLLISSVLVGLTFIPSLPAQDFFNNHPLIALALLVISIISLLVLTCGRNMARKKPHNYILLFVFTCCLSYTLAFVASFSRSFIVLLSLLFTLTIVLGSICSVLRSSTDQEFSKKKCFLGQSVPLIIALGATGIIFPNIFVSALVSAGIVILLSVHLLFDIHMLFGNFESKYNQKDYILASLDIYADVCLIFIHALKLFKELL